MSVSASLIPQILISLSSCQYIQVQVQLAALLGLHGTHSGISIKSIASLIANNNVKTAYQEFCNDLSQIGVTEDVIREKEDQILEILKSQGIVFSSQSKGIVSSSQIGRSDKLEDQALETAYHEYCKHLNEIGFTEDIIPSKAKILEILRSRGMVVASSQDGDRNTTDDTNTEDEGQLGVPFLYMSRY